VASKIPFGGANHTVRVSTCPQNHTAWVFSRPTEDYYEASKDSQGSPKDLRIHFALKLADLGCASDASGSPLPREWGLSDDSPAVRWAFVHPIAPSSLICDMQTTEHDKRAGGTLHYFASNVRNMFLIMISFTSLFGDADCAETDTRPVWEVTPLGLAYGLLASALFLLQSLTGISALTLGDGHRYPPRLLVAFLACRRSARIAVLLAQGISVIWAVAMVTASKGENALAVFLLAMVLWIGPGESAKHWKMTKMAKHERSLLAQLRSPYTRMRDRAYLEGLAPHQRNGALSPGLQVRVWNQAGNQLSATKGWEPADYGWIRQFTGVGQATAIL
jgi:hypothetical protein